jgi:mutator protein MutT
MLNSSSINDADRDQGAIAVILRDDRFLVIQRAKEIRAGGLFCFPGGGIEPGENSRQAVVRELKEELGVEIRPVREVWSCTTAWSVDLSWWLAEMDEDAKLVPDPSEVQWVGWKSLAEIKSEPKMLSSNIEFIAGVESGSIKLD